MKNKMAKFVKIGKHSAVRKSLTEIAHEYTKPMDKYIFRKERVGNCTYVYGVLVITYLASDEFKVDFSLYFKDPDSNWGNAGGDGRPEPLKILTDEAIHELKEKKQVKFVIDESVRTGAGHEFLRRPS